MAFVQTLALFFLLLLPGFNLTVPVSHLGPYAFALKSRSLPAEGAGRFAVDTLDFKALMADLQIQTPFLEKSVLVFSPQSPLFAQLSRLVPVTVFAGTEAVGIYRAICQDNVRMGIAFFCFHIFPLVNGEYSAHTLSNENLPDVIPGQRNSIPGRQVHIVRQ